MRSDTVPAMITEVLQKEANLLWYLNSRELKLLILHPLDRGEQINEWIERKGQSFREYKNTLFFALADAAAYGRLREDVKTWLALAEIKREVESDLKSPLAAKRQEIQDRMFNIRRDFSYNVRRVYHTLRVGARTYDLGQPVADNETLGHWYWRELTSKDIGAIVESLHYRTLVNKLMAGNEQVATSVILDQFYKNSDLPAPASEEVLARAVQLGVQEGAFGLVMGEGEITRDMLRYREPLPLGVISFEPGFSLLANAACEALTAQWRKEDEARRQEEEFGQDVGGGTEPGGAGYQVKDRQDEDSEEEPIERTVYHQVRLVINDVPASRIADVNRGIFMPLSAASDQPLTFTLTLAVSSEEGISQETLEHKIKETIRQIGAWIDEEQLT